MSKEAETQRNELIICQFGRYEHKPWDPRLTGITVESDLSVQGCIVLRHIDADSAYFLSTQAALLLSNQLRAAAMKAHAEAEGLANEVL